MCFPETLFSSFCRYYYTTKVFSLKG